MGSGERGCVNMRGVHFTPLLLEGGVPKGRGGRFSRKVINQRVMFSPTTSPWRVLLLPEGGEPQIPLF